VTLRLHVRIALAFLALLVAGFLTVAMTTVALRPDDRDEPEVVALLGALVEGLPDADDPSFPERLHALGARLRADLTLRDRDGEVIGAAGPVVPPGPAGRFRDGRRVGLRADVSGERQLAYAPHDRAGRGPVWLAALGALTAVVALGTWPVARGLTRRLDAVREAVAAFGAGDLHARAPVLGGDEVAAVAAAFNEAAARVARGVEADRRTLASVSHELRSPLARLRLALELIGDAPGADRRLLDEAQRDVDELDATVGELLQVGHLQGRGLAERVPVDLAELVGEVAPDVPVAGGPAVVTGDRRLLARLVRNLVENARRHGAPPVRISVGPGWIDVSDGGPGVPADQTERVFEPFHRAAGHAEGRDGGVGLGLWLVREIARAHGGDAVVDPAAPATVHVTLG